MIASVISSNNEILSSNKEIISNSNKIISHYHEIISMNDRMMSHNANIVKLLLNEDCDRYQELLLQSDLRLTPLNYDRTKTSHNPVHDATQQITNKRMLHHPAHTATQRETNEPTSHHPVHTASQRGTNERTSHHPAHIAIQRGTNERMTHHPVHNATPNEASVTADLDRVFATVKDIQQKTHSFMEDMENYRIRKRNYFEEIGNATKNVTEIKYRCLTQGYHNVECTPSNSTHAASREPDSSSLIATGHRPSKEPSRSTI